jgi:DNA gyrase subunit B
MSEDYSTDLIQVLTIPEGVRTRPAMYFGSVDSTGLSQFVWELVANVIDLYLVDRATLVQVEIDGGTISVSDDGPGLPFDELSESAEGISRAEEYFTYFHTTRSQDNHAPHIHLISMGLGLSVLNSASSQVIVRSWRSGKLWEQRFARGKALGLAIILEEGEGRGTQLYVTPDPEIFGQAQLDLLSIRKTLLETSHLFSGLRIGWQAEWFHVPQEWGLAMLGEMWSGEAPDVQVRISDRMESFVGFRLAIRHGDVLIEVALIGEQQLLPSRRSSELTTPQIISWVNGSRTSEHGSHVAGLMDALGSVQWQPALSLIHVVMYDPAFAGPTRNQLDAPHIRQAVQEALRLPLLEHLS